MMKRAILLMTLVAVTGWVRVACGDTIHFREGGGTGFANVTFDDTYVNTAAGGTSNYGDETSLQTQTNAGPNVVKYILIGITGMFTELPGTSGGDPIVIDNAVLTLYQVGTTSQTIALRRVTSDWLLTTAGSNEINVSGEERDMANDLDWFDLDDFGSGDYTDVGGSQSSTPGVNGGAHAFNVTDIVQDMYDCNLNAGFTLFIPVFDSQARPTYSSSEATSVGARPSLFIEYHYESSVIPEPGTMLLVGTGVLGVIGYLRRRRLV